MFNRDFFLHLAATSGHAALLILAVAPAAGQESGPLERWAAKHAAGSAETQSPGTLLSWRYGSQPAGGPKLDEPLVTDRPDFTESSVTVGKGVLQIESGYTYSFDNDGTQTVGHSYPETLLRYGVFADWLEVRLAWNYANEIVDGVESGGAEDLYLGFKITISPQDGFLPETAIIPQMTVPTGARAFRGDAVDPGFNVLYAWDVTDRLSTGGSTQINRTNNPPGGPSFTEFAQSWTVGYSLTERLGVYSEWFAVIPSGGQGPRPEHYLDGGFSFLFSDDLQWDIRGGVGLNAAADDYFAGTGLSLRFQ